MRVKLILPNGSGLQMTLKSGNMTMAHLLQRVRRYCHVESHEGLFIMVDTDGVESIPMMSMKVSQLGDNQVIKVLKESTFGCGDDDEVVRSWSYEYSYLVPCLCSPRVAQLHGPIYDSEGTRYNLDKWVRIDVLSDGPHRRKRATTACVVCRSKLDGRMMLGQVVRTNLL